MRDLVVRVTALDPQASGTLQVVAYFDELVTGRVGVDGLLRGAALLAGCPVGFRGRSRAARVGPNGDRLDPGVDASWPLRVEGEDWMVWLEREAAQANDDMIMERLALAVRIALAQPDSSGQNAVSLLLDPTIGVDDRSLAAARLRLVSTSLYRVVARPATDAARLSAEAVRGRTAVLATRFGLVRAAVIVADGDRPDLAGRGVGVGPAVPPVDLPGSWEAALVALRLAGEDTPVVYADDLGALVLLADVDETRAATHPDVVAVTALAGRGGDLATRDALTASGSTRAAARALGIHHSTVQARLLVLTDRLGFDPQTPRGRTRYLMARVLCRLGLRTSVEE